MVIYDQIDPVLTAQNPGNIIAPATVSVSGNGDAPFCFDSGEAKDTNNYASWHFSCLLAVFVSGIRRLSQVANFRVAARGFHARMV